MNSTYLETGFISKKSTDSIGAKIRMAINTYCDALATPTENCDPISFFATISTNLFEQFLCLF